LRVHESAIGAPVVFSRKIPGPATFDFATAAIAALGAHFGLTLDRDRCFPYGR
jgi:hypothetical protein